MLVLFHAYAFAATAHSHRQHKRSSFIIVLFFFSSLTYCFTTVQQRWIKPMHIRSCSDNVLRDFTALLHLFKTSSGTRMKARTFYTYFTSPRPLRHCWQLSYGHATKLFEGELNFVAWPDYSVTYFYLLILRATNHCAPLSHLS